MSVEEIIERLELQPHPEGGYYRETYRSEGSIPADVLNSGFPAPRNFCTSIYYLLTRGNFSAFHRLKQDELWFYHGGDSLIVHEIRPDGMYIRHEVGNPLSIGRAPQTMVPAGSWFASEISPGGEWALVGCVVSPGFDFDDFELADSGELLGAFSQHKEVIERLTR